MNPWLVVTIDGREHFIARAQVIEVVFNQQPPMISEGGYKARPARQGETPTQPATFHAVIVTTMPSRDTSNSPAIELFGDDAHALYQQLQREAGTTSGASAAG